MTGAARLAPILLGSAVFLAGLLPHSALAASPAAGVNIVNPMRASEAARTALIGQLQAAGVHLVRCALTDDPAGIAFAKAARAHGHVPIILTGSRRGTQDAS